MRLNDFTTSTLSEAITFGNKELSYIKQFSKDFKVGIEFEFLVEQGNIEFSENSESVDRYISSWHVLNDVHDMVYDRIIEDGGVLEDIMIAIYALSSTVLNKYWIKALIIVDEIANTTLLLNEEEEFRNALERLILRDYNYNNVMSNLEICEKFFSVSLRETFKSLYEDAGFIQRCLDLFDEGNVLETLIELEDIDTLGFASLYETLKDFTNHAGEVEDYTTALNILARLDKTNEYRIEYHRISQDIEQEERARVVAEGDMNFQLGNAEAVEYVQSNIYEYVDRKYIEKIIEDGSLDVGAEVVTIPLQIEDVPIAVKQINNYIKKFGYTDETTGLHLNISHKSFSDSDINLLKFLILHDLDLHQNTSLTSVLKQSTWEERSEYVRNVGKRINSSTIRKMAREITTTNGNAFLNQIEYLLTKLLIGSEKYSSINLKNVIGGQAKLDTGRIELRYLGGTEYEYRSDDILNTMYYSMYTLLAAVDDNFLKKEYHQALIKLLNKRSRGFYGMDFLDLVKETKTNGRIEPYMNYEPTKVNYSKKHDTKLNESFRDVRKKFEEDSGNKVEVRQYLTTFRELVISKKIKVQYKTDIVFWLDKDWNEFKAFIDSFIHGIKYENGKIIFPNGSEFTMERDLMKLVEHITMIKPNVDYEAVVKYVVNQSIASNAIHFINKQTNEVILTGVDDTKKWHLFHQFPRNTLDFDKNYGIDIGSLHEKITGTCPPKLSKSEILESITTNNSLSAARAIIEALDVDELVSYYPTFDKIALETYKKSGESSNVLNYIAKQYNTHGSVQTSSLDMLEKSDIIPNIDYIWDVNFLTTIYTRMNYRSKTFEVFIDSVKDKDVFDKSKLLEIYERYEKRFKV